MVMGNREKKKEQDKRHWNKGHIEKYNVKQTKNKGMEVVDIEQWQIIERHKETNEKGIDLWARSLSEG